MNTINTATPGLSGKTRWWQLLFGVIAMMAISSPQYVWALFTTELTASLSATLPEVQVTFAILIVAQTFLSPFQGFLVDKFGPRLLLSLGAILTALSWILAAQVSGVWGLYLTYGLLGGVGTGIIYVGVVGLMVQWFPDKRGFAVGMVAAGYGFGAILTTFAISASIKSSGVPSTLMTFGLILGVVGFLAAQGMRRPKSNEVATLVEKYKSSGANTESAYSYRPQQMLKKPVFWLMFIMMTMMSTSGLMVISQMGAFAKDFGVHDAMVFGMAALPLALTIDRFANGLTRPFFGWVSDRIGRENTMFIAFGMEGVAMTLWLMTSDNPVLFVLLSGVVFFGWGEIFSLFPSILTDTFGTGHATTNYGFLYMAQGVGSVLGGPLAAMMHDATGSWTPVFVTVICMDFLTAFLAIIILKPMRRRFLSDTKALASGTAAMPAAQA
ncbi:oxalate/formate MFS antiporter [Oxalicibacterium flavum]|uniref:Oxalate/formate MFS antiporter n=1 Tax=Oxalicibacterium flavum TaxID=179467 RepID=A0A8J2UKT7_9BURK|nr:oxalate/formate MFS antiporter [Oxalicibacterium flavum]GGB95897.1 oxalate/formate MFS antiporter [Oxalicibacterium flavum]